MKSLCWFERCGTVPHWIQLAIEKSKCCIRKAIEDDSPIPVTDCVNYSSSAHHTEGFLRQTGNFWKNLDWPEPLMSSCYAVMVVNGIAECCVFYVSETAKRLDCTEELFDEKGNFKVCQKVSKSFENSVWFTVRFPLSLSLCPSLPPPPPTHPLSLSLSHAHVHTCTTISYAYFSIMWTTFAIHSLSAPNG